MYSYLRNGSRSQAMSLTVQYNVKKQEKACFFYSNAFKFRSSNLEMHRIFTYDSVVEHAHVDVDDTDGIAHTLIYLP